MERTNSVQSTSGKPPPPGTPGVSRAVRETHRGLQNLFRGSPDQIPSIIFICIILKVIVMCVCRLVRTCWPGRAHDVLSRATGWFPRFPNGWASPGEGWGDRARASRNSKLQILDFGLDNSLFSMYFPESWDVSRLWVRGGRGRMHE